MRNRNIVSDSPSGTHFIIDTPEGRGLNGYSWVISESDLFDHTPWSRSDLETLTDDEMDSHTFPRGVRGFFIP
jgi:hypothetical protein